MVRTSSFIIIIAIILIIITYIRKTIYNFIVVFEDNHIFFLIWRIYILLCEAYYNNIITIIIIKNI